MNPPTSSRLPPANFAAPRKRQASRTSNSRSRGSGITRVDEEIHPECGRSCSQLRVFNSSDPACIANPSGGVCGLRTFTASDEVTAMKRSALPTPPVRGFPGWRRCH